jgi:thymidylate kinase
LFPAPDIVIYLEVTPKVQKERGNYCGSSKQIQMGDERCHESYFQTKIVKAYESLEDPTWIRVDGGRPVDEVHTEICKIAVEAIQQCQEKQLKSLWENK